MRGKKWECAGMRGTAWDFLGMPRNVWEVDFTSSVALPRIPTRSHIPMQFHISMFPVHLPAFPRFLAHPTHSHASVHISKQSHTFFRIPLHSHAFSRSFTHSYTFPRNLKHSLIRFHICPRIPTRVDTFARIPAHSPGVARNCLVAALSHVVPPITIQYFAVQNIPH